jgi:hypothetical protein
MSNTDIEKEIENCCPLCGGKITDVIKDLAELEKLKAANSNWDHTLIRYKYIYKTLKLKLKMIEMGLIPK